MAKIANTVAVAKEQFGVRVFNLSINMISPVEEDQYGPFAEQLDAIADENDALFIISAGNLTPSDYRPLWPDTASEALKMLAERSAGDSGEAERLFRKEAERHSGMIPNTIGA